MVLREVAKAKGRLIGAEREEARVGEVAPGVTS
jgi:hypothetical protein